jgi:hypothetical protein
MTIRTACALMTIAASLGTGCAGHANYDPFLIPQARIYGAVKTIALAPVVEPGELGSVDPDRGKFATLITAQLRAAGFTVVPPEESDSIWKRVTDSLGGLFSAATGDRDTMKLNAARGVTMRELQARFHADAWLHPHIVFAQAKFDQGDAQWDGAKQSYQSFGKKFLTALFGGGTYGKTAALSFVGGPGGHAWQGAIREPGRTPAVRGPARQGLGQDPTRRALCRLHAQQQRGAARPGAAGDAAG